MAERFDIVILGGGNAGLGVSAVAAPAGRTIAFVEDRDFGGTCPNRGCTPKKVLVAAAHALDEIERAAVHGISVGRPTLDWARLIDREKAMVAHVPAAMKALAAKRGTVIEAKGRFVGPRQVMAGDRLLEAEHIVIATGSAPRRLPIAGAELMITSDDVLAERALPGEVVFVGGGVIAMEFSHVYVRAGARVTVLEVAPQMLPNLDEDAVAVLRAESERLGIAVRTGVEVQEISRRGGRLRVRYGHEGKEETVEADRVVNGAGRVADVDGLDLDAAGIRHDGRSIVVDDYLRSVSNPAVWVCGDALTISPQLSPLATYEGRLVGRNIVEGPRHRPEYEVIPNCVYTVPALASVGLSQAQAEARGHDAKISVNDMTSWFSGKSYGETAAWAKVLIDRKHDRFLGAHIVGHRGEELIQLFALAMKHGLTASQVKDTPFAFPTFASDVKNLY